MEEKLLSKINFQITLSFIDFLNANNTVKRIKRWTLLGIMLFVAKLGVFCAWAYTDFYITVWLYRKFGNAGLILEIAVILIFLIAFVFLRRRMLKTAFKTSKFMNPIAEFSFSEDNIIYSADEKSRTIYWSEINKTFVSKEYLVFKLASEDVIVIPIFEISPEKEDFLHTLLNNKLGRRVSNDKYQKADKVIKLVLLAILSLGAGFGISLFFNPEGDFGKYIALAIILFCIFSISRTFKIQKKLSEGMKFFSNCDPEKAMEIFEKALGSQKGLYHRLQLAINKSACLSHLGKYSEGLEVLHKIDINNSKVPPIFKITYYNNLNSLYLGLKEIDLAKKALDKAFDTFNTVKNPNKMITGIFHNLTLSKLSIEILEGSFDNVEESLLSELKMSKTRTSLVEINFDLAKLYLKLSRKEEAKECLQYVIENGNKLYCVEEAKDLLYNSKLL